MTTYSSPQRTWAAGEYPTAAQYNRDLRDNVQAIAEITVGGVAPAWTSYTPTLTQSATVTKTVTYARYTRVGRIVTVQFDLAVTGAGTIANDVVVGMPPIAAAQSSLMLGGGIIFDASAVVGYSGWVELNATTPTAKLRSVTAAQGHLGTVTFTAALASGDIVRGFAQYEAAA